MSVVSLSAHSELKKIQNSAVVTVVDFYATWCGPCMAIKKPYADLSRRLSSSGVVCCQVDVDEAEELAAQFRVKCLPTFVIFSGDQKVRCIQGADLAEVEAAVAGQLRGSKRAEQASTPVSAVVSGAKQKKSKKSAAKDTKKSKRPHRQ